MSLNIEFFFVLFIIQRYIYLICILPTSDKKTNCDSTKCRTCGIPENRKPDTRAAPLLYICVTQVIRQIPISTVPVRCRLLLTPCRTPIRAQSPAGPGPAQCQTITRIKAQNRAPAQIWSFVNGVGILGATGFNQKPETSAVGRRRCVRVEPFSPTRGGQMSLLNYTKHAYAEGVQLRPVFRARHFVRYENECRNGNQRWIIATIMNLIGTTIWRNLHVDRKEQRMIGHCLSIRVEQKTPSPNEELWRPNLAIWFAVQLAEADCQQISKHGRVVVC